ncbi:MAG: DHHA1 domain-containing protein, partial [Microbacterium gubbeenense]|uniref:DHHA1 domain-containing protein n=1 Tax=Microbacterium gubbeenense TaxID=159896 RepID=UPI003F9CB04C
AVEGRAIAPQGGVRRAAPGAVGAFVGVVGARPVVVIATTEAARQAGAQAGALVKTATGVLGGGGGGKPDLAQGGGQDATRVDAALDAVRAAVLAL